MCLTPIYHSDGKVFACRECNSCLELRLNAWVSRALAESVVAGHTYAITMTYADLPNGQRPIGATVFDYSDIQRFLKHLRVKYHRLYGGQAKSAILLAVSRGLRGPSVSIGISFCFRRMIFVRLLNGLILKPKNRSRQIM